MRTATRVRGVTSNRPDDQAVTEVAAEAAVGPVVEPVPEPLGPLLVVDAANVVGSVPDGWWRDRHAANERLRDRLAEIAATGLDPTGDRVPTWACHPGLEVVLVVEGQARGVTSTASVRVVAAPGSGDDAVVEVVRRDGVNRRCLVVTADRELRARVMALGAEAAGPSAVLR